MSKETIWLLLGSRDSVPRRELLATPDRVRAERALEWHRAKAIGLTRYWLEEQQASEEAP